MQMGNVVQGKESGVLSAGQTFVFEMPLSNGWHSDLLLRVE